MAIVTKANLATYLAGLTPSATPYPIEITEATALDWSDNTESPPIRTIIVNNTPPGVFLDLRTTTVPNCTYYYILVACPQLVYPPTLSEGLGIMTSCFAYCVNLKEAPVLPSTTRILQREFTDCILLTSLPVFNSGIESIQIRGCSAITQLNNLPETLLTLAISDFSSLLEVENIPASVTILGLRDCPSLITIKSFCVDVDNCSINFTGTISLESIYVPYLEESTWHLLHTDTDATGTDYTIYNPDGTVAGSGTVAGTSQVLTLYGKSDELVISANITPTLAVETATAQVQWHKSGLPYDDELMIFNAKNPTTVISNLLITTLRYSASFTLPTYLDGQKLRIANTHATNTITCTLPTGQTCCGQTSFVIQPKEILSLELIGTSWYVNTCLTTYTTIPTGGIVKTEKYSDKRLVIKGFGIIVTSWSQTHSGSDVRFGYSNVITYPIAFVGIQPLISCTAEAAGSNDPAWFVGLRSSGSLSVFTPIFGARVGSLDPTKYDFIADGYWE